MVVQRIVFRAICRLLSESHFQKKRLKNRLFFGRNQKIEISHDPQVGLGIKLATDGATFEKRDRR